MASNVTAQSVLEKISVDHLECSICTNRFRQPKLLDCLHSFCLQCLQELRQSQDPSGTKLTCPLCRHETMLKGSGVADLPNNFAFSALVEEVTMQEMQLEGQGSEIKCQACDEENQAVSRCMDCDHFLCQECQKAHERLTLMKSHQIYTLAQLRSGEIVYKSKLRDEVPKCGKHPDQNLNVYCDTCEQVICLMCTVLDHEKPKHSCIGLPEAFEKCKKKVEELVAKVGRSKTELNTTIEKTCISRKKLDFMFSNTKKNISEKAGQEVAKIRQEEQKLLKETDRIYQERVTTFEAALAKNSKEVTKTEHKLEEVKQLMNQASCHEILELQQKLLHNLSELTGKQPQQVPDKLTFMDFEEGDKSLGRLILEEEPKAAAKKSPRPARSCVKEKWELKTEVKNFELGNTWIADVAALSTDKLPVLSKTDVLFGDSGALSTASIPKMYNHHVIYIKSWENELLCVDYYGASVFSVDMASNMHLGWGPTGVCCDSDGSIYVAVCGHSTVLSECLIK
ncbi:E3 ubiquitin-protein ligase TRIM71-like [Patiria miniata]|uniref:Uncharacterized protein n=1 Tax=Patiria miniata TaxID=46514 RepID=A0A913ZSC1_PATMI|nr:E3 ubiquitin-protein ligase TRIM71-like [Patiria miniata]